MLKYLKALIRQPQQITHCRRG